MQISTAETTQAVPLIVPHNEKDKAGKEFDKVYEAYVNYLDKNNALHICIGWNYILIYPKVHWTQENIYENLT